MKNPALLLLAMMVPLVSCGEGAEGGGDLTSQISVFSDNSQIVNVSPAKLQAAITARDIRLIDVRSDAEVAGGIIPGAEHIPLDGFDPAALDLSDGRGIVLYCEGGVRSAKAARKLAEFTGKPAKHLDGGISAWKDAKLPVSER
ncbi:MAG: rhodanese-like domain-containing protein [Erythrobacter sp.]